MLPMRMQEFDGVLLEVPDHPEFFWPHPTFEGFHDCCGPGAPGSITVRIVQDRPLGVIWSPACWVHDVTYSLGPKSRARFKQSNEVFFRNLLAVNAVRGRHLPVRRLRDLNTLAWHYYVAVDRGGWLFYMRAGRSQRGINER